MPRRHRHLPLLALLVLAGACAPMRQAGTLSPIGARVTNEVIGQDAETLDAWARRVSELRQPTGTVPAARDVALARAAAWLAYARDAYSADPRDGVADAALDEARRLIVPLEQGTVPDNPSAAVATELRARPDLWAALDSARHRPLSAEAPVALAGAELALVRASRLAADNLPTGDATARPMTEFERVCELQTQVALAERLLLGLRAPGAVVAQQGESTPPVVAALAPVAAAPVAPPAARSLAAVPARAARHGVERVVHFAVNSSELALSSRVTLGEVIAMLRSHPGVNLVIEGFTDARGDPLRNRELSIKRADAVRRFLDAADLALGRVTIAGIGADSTAAGHASAGAFARDRRVTLAFTGPDGEPLTLSTYQALGLDHERDLQVEQERARGRAPRSTARSTTHTASRSATRAPARGAAASRSTPR